MEIYVTENSGRRRKAKIVTCERCGKEFKKAITQIKATKHNYCSLECRKESKHKCECAWCGEDVFVKPSRLTKSKSGLVFCNKECKDRAARLDGGISDIHPTHYGAETISTYRQVAFREYPNECEHCGWKEYISILEVHHIDGNRENSTKENLMILCPTCHRMVTYGIKVINENRIWEVS